MSEQPEQKDEEREPQAAEKAPAPILPPVDWLDRLLFVPAMAAFGLSLLLFDPLQRLALLMSQDTQQKVVAALNWCLKASLSLGGVKFRTEGIDPVPAGEPVIVIANHQSLFDIPILHCVFQRHWPRFVAKKELARGIPSVSFNLRNGGSAIIDRSNPRQAIPEIQRFAKRLKAQHFCAVLFPEGTRARDGVVKSFRPAGVSTLIQHAESAHVLLVAIDNSWILSARKFGFPRGTLVKVRILGELDRSGHKAKDLVEQAETRIREGIRALRQE